MDNPESDQKVKEVVPLDADDIALLKSYVLHYSYNLTYYQGRGPYATNIKELEDNLKKISKQITDLRGIICIF